MEHQLGEVSRFTPVANQIADEQTNTRFKMLVCVDSDFNLGVSALVHKLLTDSGFEIGSENVVKRQMELIYDSYIHGAMEYRTNKINNVLLSKPTETEVLYIAELVITRFKPRLNVPVTNGIIR